MASTPTSYLQKLTCATVERLQRRHADWRPSIYLDATRRRLNISSQALPYRYLGVYSAEKLPGLLVGIHRVVLAGLSPMDTYLKAILPGWQPAYCRIAFEIAKKLPSWRMKNRIYRHCGVDIANPPPIVSPNVLLDYIFPRLIHIGGNTIIGEGATVLTHLLYPDRMEFGPVRIGRNCTIGVNSIIFPGVRIGDGATVAAGAVADHDVAPGATLIATRR